MSGEELAGRRLWILRQGRKEQFIHGLLFFCIVISVLTTLGIVLTLLVEGVGFFGAVSLQEFFGSVKWTPLFDPQQFGVWPLVSGTLLVAFIAAVVALPLGLAGAIFLAEYLPAKASKLIKPLLEVLAGIPSIVYGYFALTYVTPLLRGIVPELGIFNALSAGLVMGIMILPLVVSLSQDAMLAVPISLRAGAYALGATRLEVVLRVVVPAALSGIIAAFILAISRAVGETMLVTIAAGSTPILTFDPRASIQTMTAYIAQVSLGETPHGTTVYQTIFAVGLLLFCLTLAMNTLSQAIVRRYEQRYL